jgi:hypothetical protein
MEDSASRTPHLNPADLYNKRQSKDAARLRAYNKILEQIYHRIRTISKLQNSPCSLLYTIPPFILGLPRIDMEDCVVYLIHQLRHANYEVRYTPPNMLYISWQHHEKSYLMEQSPIMQSMMESYERTQAELERKEKEASRLLAPKKSQRKVQFQAPGSNGVPMAAARPSAASRPAAGPAPPSAAQYVPPNSFLQNLSNPTPQLPSIKSVPEYFNR